MSTTFYNTSDALLIQEKTLATGTIATDPLDLTEISARGGRLEDYALRITAESSALAAAASFAFTLQFSDTENFASATEFSCTDWRQAGSASGAEEFIAEFKVPPQVQRYVRLRSVATGTVGTLTAKMILSLHT